ncbi:MAG: hypothetical protein J0L62_11850 [Bacteroidetes bacterium]|nr:hypothetical protein [Bacteroidota bacterium]
MKFASLFIFSCLFISGSGFAQTEERVKEPAPKEFQFIGYFFTRATTTNITPTNELLQGQVIGRLFGPNSTTTLDRQSLYTEQRFVPLFVYKPSILDGYATFRSLFKIDFTWGDQSYGAGNNRGGGLSGGQVNLQTLMANVELKEPGSNWNLVIGLQRIFDNVRDPNINTLTIAQTSGYKLSFWGTQGVGITTYGKFTPATLAKFGVYQLWENEISRDDDVILAMADIEHKFMPLLEVGADLWMLHDKAKGAGGIGGSLSQGMTSNLTDYNGTMRLHFPSNISKYNASVAWLGTRVAWNRDFLAGRLWFDAYAITNFGVIDTIGATGTKKAADIIGGLALNAQIAYKYGMTANDKISAEVQYTSGDKNNATDGKISTVLTGNVWGSPVGIYSSHKAYLLFPDAQVVNRYYSAVHDISNMGYGVTGLFLNVYNDIIPNKFSGKVGIATAMSMVSPPGGKNYIGTEYNAEFRYNLKVFLTLSISGAYLKLGDFYNSPLVSNTGKKPLDPWVCFTTLNWLMF